MHHRRCGRCLLGNGQAEATASAARVLSASSTKHHGARAAWNAVLRAAGESTVLAVLDEQGAIKLSAVVLQPLLAALWAVVAGVIIDNDELQVWLARAATLARAVRWSRS